MLLDDLCKCARAEGGLRVMPAMMTQVRFCAIGVLVRSAYMMTGDQEHAHRLGWKVAGLIASAPQLPRVDEDEGWSLAMLSDQAGAK